MKKLLLLLLVIGSVSVYAQNVVTTSGGSGESFAWSIGQIVTETIVGDDVIVSQGVVQPEKANLSSIESSAKEMLFRVYPNPVENDLFVKIDGTSAYKWQIVDVVGKLILSGTSDSELEKIDMSEFSSGQYILTINSEEYSQSVIILKK